MRIHVHANSVNIPDTTIFFRLTFQLLINTQFPSTMAALDVPIFSFGIMSGIQHAGFSTSPNTLENLKKVVHGHEWTEDMRRRRRCICH